MLYFPPHPLLTRFLFITVFCYFPFFMLAQQGGRNSYSFMPKFQHTTLLVVQYEDGSGYDEAIKQVIEDSWTFTPYEVVNVATLEERVAVAPKDYFMLVRDNSERSRHGNVSHLIRRNHLAIYPCVHGTRLSNYNGRMAIAQFEVENIDEYERYAPFLPGFVRAMQDYIVYCDSSGVNGNNYEPLLEAYHTSRVGELRDMTLFLVAEDLPPSFTEADWIAAYAHEMYVINKSTLPALLAEGAENIAFLHLAPEAEEFWVIGMHTGAMFYCAKPKEFKSFGPRDLRILSDRILNPEGTKGGKLGRLLRRF